MDDIFGQIMLTAGDEDLSAVQPIAAIGRGLGLGPHEVEITAGLRFSEQHGSGPLAADQLG